MTKERLRQIILEAKVYGMEAIRVANKIIEALESEGFEFDIPKLKQCPFCGSMNPECFAWYGEPKDTYFIKCNVCGTEAKLYY